jgi:6-phosphogluconolactonase/glucosamine-6-phosphate isomerase/deaminase
MNPEIRVFDDLDQLSRALAERSSQAAQQSATDRGLFAAALSGGSTPRLFLELLAGPDFVDRVPWASTRLFQVAGGDKAETMRRVLHPTLPQDRFPARGIEPGEGTLRWYLDRAAARRL